MTDLKVSKRLNPTNPTQTKCSVGMLKHPLIAS